MLSGSADKEGCGNGISGGVLASDLASDPEVERENRNQKQTRDNQERIHFFFGRGVSVASIKASASAIKTDGVTRNDSTGL